MKVYDGFAAARGRLSGCAVALGNFDGVHLGHQALFARARAFGGPAVAATFHPHPGKVLAQAMAPKVLTPLPRKLELLEALGLDAVVVQPFDRAYASRSAEQFLEEDLFGALDPAAVVVGRDFTYGRGRAGDTAHLRAACEARSCILEEVAPVTCEGVVVSSTKVRELVAEGRVAAAARLLGRPFELCGEVVPGLGRGRGLGFPTANLKPDSEVRPGNGVYAVRAFLQQGVFGGAANVGRKPTFGDEELTVEVFILDFPGGALYGQRMGVEFLEHLRAEQRFPSAQALAVQIGRDCDQARAVVAAATPPGPLSPWIRAIQP